MATTALALGSGIGKMFQAAALGPQMRQKAEMDAYAKRALMEQHLGQAQWRNAQTQEIQNRLGQQSPDAQLLQAMGGAGLTDQSVAPAIADRLKTGQWGGAYADVAPVDNVGPMMPAPVDNAGLANIARAMALAQRTMATSSNVQQEANAARTNQGTDQITQIMQTPDIAGLVAKAQAAAKGGRLVLPTGATGQSMDLAGNAGPVNAPLDLQRVQELASKLGLNTARAGAATSQAGASDALGLQRGANTALTNDRRTFLEKEGMLPGTESSAGGGEAATNAKTHNQRVNDARKANPTGTPDEIAADVARFDKLYASTPPNRADTRKSGQVDILNQEMDKARSALALAKTPDEQGRARADIDSLTRELGRLGAKPGSAKPAAAPKIDMGQADAIKARFKAGKLTREQAKAELQKLGMD
jgi:hypothetical protein